VGKGKEMRLELGYMRAASKMTAKEFFKAFKALPKSERDAFLLGIAGDRAMRRDLLDLATIAERQREPSRPLRDYLADRSRK
jgi:hypothetical protein